MGAFDPSGYRVRMEWGRRGAEAAAERGDVLVVVDVLRFSTTVVAAVQRGAKVYPCAEGVNPAEFAGQMDAVLAAHDRDVPGTGRYSLSPLTFASIESGAAVVLPSANGSICAASAGSIPLVFAGALVNAQATAQAAEKTAGQTGIAVLACGERWQEPSDEGVLRFAIEDYLGAGAILSHLSLPKSPEAQVCEAAFVGCRDRLQEIIWDSSSGRELRERGLEEDVRFASRLDVMDVVAVMRNGRFEKA